ncbi:MAG TPA: hypothetical protein VJM50_05275 [Pyrinomonadaceae bacterium]|nr:hypothetical protein [Pyrinomonadaceae bacterium]
MDHLSEEYFIWTLAGFYAKAGQAKKVQIPFVNETAGYFVTHLEEINETQSLIALTAT